MGKIQKQAKHKTLVGVRDMETTMSVAHNCPTKQQVFSHVIEMTQYFKMTAAAAVTQPPKQ